MSQGTDIIQMQAEVARLKQKLIIKATKKGLYENFGQNEVRYLSDKYHVFFRHDMAEELIAFEEWAQTYEG